VTLMTLTGALVASSIAQGETRGRFSYLILTPSLASPQMVERLDSSAKSMYSIFDIMNC
jgi:hypothetical protein